MAQRFVFPLHALLRVRGLREEQARRALGRKQGEINAETQAMTRVDQQIHESQRIALGSQQAAAVDPAQMTAARVWVHQLRAQRHAHEQRKVALETELAGLRATWRAAKQELEAIERLREKRALAHQQREAKRTQATLDEVALRLHHTKPLPGAERAPHSD